jgi:hypothetical protein
MIIDKTFIVWLEISDMSVIYSPLDTKEICKKILAEKYENKCYNSCLILKIGDISEIEHSMMSVIYDDLDAPIRLSVKFTAQVLIYQEGEIITNCKIQKIESNGVIFAESKGANIRFSDNGITGESIGVGDIIPLTVKLSRYIIGMNKISIYAVPFIPSFPDDVSYLVSEELTDETKIRKILSMINTEEKEIKNLDRTIVDFFNNLLYPYNNYKEPTEPIKTLEDFKSIRNGYVSRPLCLKRDRFSFIHGNKPYKNSIVLENTMNNIAQIFLSEHLQYLLKIKELATTYNTTEKFQKNMRIWKIYKLGKQEL